jgi:hypothetical protein
MAINKDVSSQLKHIKKNISASYLYFKRNYDTFHDFRKFVFETSISEQQADMLRMLGKPIIEANILEAYISRLLGEFSKHEPSINITPAEGVPVNPEVLEVVEGYIRHIIYESNKNSMSYEVYKDTLSGGFSVIKVWTEYASPMSMKQVIKAGRVFDPTLTGFDPMARASHKADGQYCFELYPMTEDDFKREYPNAKQTFAYVRDIKGFSWSYESEQQAKITLVCDYYEKKKKRTKICQLANGRVITVKNLEKLQEFWEQQQFIEQMPVVVGKPRWTELETICRYRLTELEVLEYEETDYTYLPLIFVDGNSILLRQGSSGMTYQKTRPYVYHTKGIQNLKNFSMQCLGNYLENMVQHKFIVMKEAIPQEEDYLAALNDVQRPNTIVVNAFSENDPTLPIPNPIREVQSPPAPPEVLAAFQMADPTTQTILGSYASNLGQNDNDLSGKAVIESASVGNAAAMPYVTSYLAAWTQLGNVIVDLMPKYITGKRQVPVVTKNGENGYQPVNEEGSPYLDYENSAIQCQIEAGVNFQVQKNQALQQMTALMQASQEFNSFMNSPRGLPILVKNMTIYGADELQEAVPQYLQEQAQQQQQAMEMQQQQMMQDPRMLKAQVDMQKAQIEMQAQQLKAQEAEFDHQIQIAKLSIEKELADAKILESEAKITQAQIDSSVRLEEANTSRLNHALDAASKIAEVNEKEHAIEMNEHSNHRENIKLHRELTKSEEKLTKEEE